MRYKTFVLDELARGLRTAGYEIEVYSSPQQLLAKHKPAVPGCALLDMAMPEVDGLQLQQKLECADIDQCPQSSGQKIGPND